MKDAQPKAIRLSEYRPPDHSITDTRLEFDLRDGVTQVTSQLSVRRTGTQSTLRLDGQELELVSVAVDGRPLTSNEYQTDDDSLTLFDLPEACDLTIVTRIHPEQNVALEGLYKSGGRSGGMYCTQCEAEGFRKITYYLDRPDVLAKFTTTIIADPAYPVLLSNGNLIDEHERAGWTAQRHLAGSVSETELSVRARRRRSRAAARRIRHGVRAPRRTAHLFGAAQHLAVRLRDGRAEARDALGRRGIRPRIRSRHLHDRRRRRLQHGRDGEQRAQHLQHVVRAGEPRHRHRPRVSARRSRRCARVLSQLVRQSGHVPRLVSVEPQGRLHGISRRGVLVRHELADREAHRRRQPAAHVAVRRGRRSAGASGASRYATSRSRTSTRPRFTRKAPK